MFQIFFLVLTVVCTFNSGFEGRKPQSPNFQLIILHNNDVHAHYEQISKVSGVCTPEDRGIGNCYGGFPKVAHVVKEYRTAATNGGPPVLYLNTGDTYDGIAWYSLYNWRIAADFINALQPDALSLGNNDIEVDGSKVPPLLRNINVPILALNVILKNNSKAVQTQKSIVLDIDGVKVGLIGYLHPLNKLLIKQDIEYTDEIKAVNAEANLLKVNGVEILIALGHSFFGKDIEIAKEVTHIDLVIDGYKNAYFWNGLNVQKFSEQREIVIVHQKSGRRIPVLKSYTYSEYLGKVHLIFDAHGEIIEFDNTPVCLNKEIPQDEDILKIVNAYNSNISVSKEAVGQLAIPLLSHICGIDECNLGNLITDAMVYKYEANSENERVPETPAAIIHSGYIASSIPSSSLINIKDLIKVLPAESIIVAVIMTGEILKQVLEHSVSNYDSSNPTAGFLQYSGINVMYDLDMPIGARVVSSLIRCSSCNVSKFKAIEESSTYKILMPRVLAKGENGYLMLAGLPAEEQNYDELTSLHSYMKQNNSIFSTSAKRIKLLNVLSNNGTKRNNPTHDNVITSAKITTRLRTTTRRPTVTLQTTTRYTAPQITTSRPTTPQITFPQITTSHTTISQTTTTFTTTTSTTTTTTIYSNITTENSTFPITITSPAATTAVPGMTPNSASGFYLPVITLFTIYMFFIFFE